MSEGENAILDAISPPPGTPEGVKRQNRKPTGSNCHQVAPVIVAKAILAVEKKPTIKSPELAKILKISHAAAGNALKKAKKELTGAYREKAKMSLPLVLRQTSAEKAAKAEEKRVDKLNRECDELLELLAGMEDKSSKAYSMAMQSLQKATYLLRQASGLDTMVRIAEAAMKSVKPGDTDSPRNVTPGGW